MSWDQVRSAFRPVGELTIDDAGQLKWTADKSCEKSGSVYVWLLEPGLGDLPETVVYVGKAKNGWAVRCKAHNTGMRSTFRQVESARSRGGEPSGEWARQYQERAGWLAEGRTIKVYEAAAPTITAFGETRRAEDALEKILINKLDPLYNRA